MSDPLEEISNIAKLKEQEVKALKMKARAWAGLAVLVLVGIILFFIHVARHKACAV